MEEKNEVPVDLEKEEEFLMQAFCFRDRYYALNTGFVKNVLIFSLCWFVLSLIWLMLSSTLVTNNVGSGHPIFGGVVVTSVVLGLVEDIGLYVFSVISTLSALILFLIRYRNKREFEKYFQELSLVLENREFFDRSVGNRRFDTQEVLTERRQKEDRRTEIALTSQNNTIPKKP